ncbi:hypothetical protein PT2222_70216 [Paraburkholderia tropica]
MRARCRAMTANDDHLRPITADLRGTEDVREIMSGGYRPCFNSNFYCNDGPGSLFDAI